MEGGYMVENSAKRLCDYSTVCSTEGRARRCGLLVCYLRCRGWRNVSFESKSVDKIVLTVHVSRLLFGVIYWYLWTVFIPRLGGYHLEEETDILKDGTSVTKLVKVKHE